MIKRILLLSFAVILCIGLSLPVFAVYRTGVYVLDETGDIPYNKRTSLNQHAKDISAVTAVDIVYVRADAENLAEYAQGLRLGSRYDQIMLIENDSDRQVLFFGKAKVLTPDDAQKLLDTYAAESDCTLGIYNYVEAAWLTVMERGSEGAFDDVPEEYLEKLPRLVDDAWVLSSPEERALLQRLDEISLRQGIDVVLVTVRNLCGESLWTYAEDFYQDHAYNDDGILLLVHDKEWWLFTFGDANTAFTDDGQKYITKQVGKELKKGEYAQAFNQYADLCDAFMTQARSGEPYDGQHMPKGPFRLELYLVISLLAGIFAGCIALRIQMERLRSVRFHYGAAGYLDVTELELTEDKEIYLYSTTVKRLKT